jgi:hypothetical protein
MGVLHCRFQIIYEVQSLGADEAIESLGGNILTRLQITHDRDLFIRFRHVKDVDPPDMVAAKTARVGAVANFKDMSLNVGRMPCKELFYVVPVHRLAAAETVRVAKWFCAAKTSKANLSNPRGGKPGPQCGAEPESGFCWKHSQSLVAQDSGH